MDLLETPAIRTRMSNIKDVYGIARDAALATTPVRGVDRFFWLRASQRTQGEGPRFVFRSMVHDMELKGRDEFRVCNLVLQGGGTLGLAHAGFVAGLEVAGVRCLGLAGTSAGSIIAMGMAAIRGGDLAKETHKKLAELSSSAPMDAFIDGPRPIRVFIKRVLQKSSMLSPATLIAAFFAMRRLRDRRGLNYGDVFEIWFESVMKDENFETIEELHKALATIWADIGELSEKKLFGEDFPPLIAPDTYVEANKSQSLLKLVATAMPIGLKFTLPEDLKYLSAEYQQVSPSSLVRTSMSIPAFFEPVTMRTDRTQWPGRVSETFDGLLPKNRVDFFRELEELVFLDGGLVSNLPSDSFRQLMQNVPTVVVPLYGDQPNQELTGRRAWSDLVSDSLACVSAVRLQRDREVWQQNAELSRAFAQEEYKRVARQGGVARQYSTRMADVNTEDKNWLNFVMSDKDKFELFETGLKAAETFLASLSNDISRSVD